MVTICSRGKTSLDPFTESVLFCLSKNQTNESAFPRRANKVKWLSNFKGDIGSAVAQR